MELREEEARHAGEVLRKRVGDVLEVFDGQGRVASARVERMERKGATLALGEVRETVRLPCEITLVMAIPKGKLMEWILEKATELGVRRVIPVITERTVVQLEGKDAQKRGEKWDRVVLEACKQCGQDWTPEVLNPRSLEAVLGEVQPAALTMFGSLYPGAVSFSEVLEGRPRVRSAMVWIGPEGDFTTREAERLVAWGATPVTLGRIVLRMETAAMFCLSVLSNAYQDTRG